MKYASRIVRNLSNRIGQKSAQFAMREENPENTHRPVAVTEALDIRILYLHEKYSIIETKNQHHSVHSSGPL
jgi:hypothetical protein